MASKDRVKRLKKELADIIGQTPKRQYLRRVRRRLRRGMTLPQAIRHASATPPHSAPVKRLVSKARYEELMADGKVERAQRQQAAPVSRKFAATTILAMLGIGGVRRILRRANGEG